jgi:hypothetical protein
MTDLPPWTLPQLERYVEIAIETMAKHGAVSADADGNPIWERGKAARAEDGTLRVELAADLSASGLPSVVPITASTQGAGPVRWSMGGVTIATIPGEWMPEEAGEAIGKHQLQAAYRHLSNRLLGGDGNRRRNQSEHEDRGKGRAGRG